jgi:hypothetical protein
LIAPSTFIHKKATDYSSEIPARTPKVGQPQSGFGICKRAVGEIMSEKDFAGDAAYSAPENTSAGLNWNDVYAPYNHLGDQSVTPSVGNAVAASADAFGDSVNGQPVSEQSQEQQQLQAQEQQVQEQQVHEQQVQPLSIEDAPEFESQRNDAIAAAADGSAGDELGINAGGDLTSAGLAISRLAGQGRPALGIAGLGVAATGLYNVKVNDSPVTNGDKLMLGGLAAMSLGDVAKNFSQLSGVVKPLKIAGTAATVLGVGTRALELNEHF